MRNNPLTPFLAMAMLMGMQVDMGSKRTDDLENVDIKKEYALIQEKKSKLSYSQRQRVISRYERMKEKC